jgi:hypothetical protein
MLLFPAISHPAEVGSGQDGVLNERTGFREIAKFTDFPLRLKAQEQAGKVLEKIAKRRRVPRCC